MPTLRHIRPRSMEWYEALLEDDQAFDRLEPEQVTRLRNMLEAEQMTIGMPPLAPRRADTGPAHPR
jgi:hypothetical protein